MPLCSIQSNLIAMNILFTLFVLVNFYSFIASVDVIFEAKLVSSDLDLNCKYKLDKEKGEKFDSLKIWKDGETFLHYTPDNYDGNRCLMNKISNLLLLFCTEPEFIKINGISEVQLNGGGKVIVQNYEDKTWGVYECGVFYRVENHVNYRSKKLRLSLKKGK